MKILSRLPGQATKVFMVAEQCEHVSHKLGNKSVYGGGTSNILYGILASSSWPSRVTCTYL